MIERGDQVGLDVEDMPSVAAKPWEQPGWFRNRLWEMLYSMLSWPYAIGIGMTVFFIVRPDGVVLQAVLGAWVLAFARREFAGYMARRQGNVRAAPMLAEETIMAAATDDDPTKP